MGNSIRAICLLVCLLLIGMPLASAGTDSENVKAVARTEIWKDINAGASGSVAIAVMDGGKIVYSEGFGMADRAKNIPVDKKTIFDIGSVSKVYTATAIMLLVDEGKVDLDKPVIAYLPEFTMADERYKDITVRMTLNHTSGLPGTTGANNFGFAFNKDVYKDLLAALAQSNLKHRPGEMATYCNDGFTLAEMIVAKVSGHSFINFLSNRIFKPLSLTNTGPGVGERQAPGVKTAKFYPLGKTYSEPYEVLSLLGAGGLSASAEDLCHFFDSFSGIGPQILSAKALAELRKEQPAEFHGKLRSPDISWGLGWDVTSLEPYKANGIQVLGKGGNSGTYTTHVFTAPDQRLTVAVVSTGRVGGAIHIADKVLTACLVEKGLMKAPIQIFTPPAKPQPIPAELKAFEGYYANGNSLLRISLDLAKGTMASYVVANTTETLQMTAVYNNGYFYKGENKYYFVAVDGKRYLAQHVPVFKADGVGSEKIEPIAAAPQMAAPIDGQKWLRRNIKAFEGIDTADNSIIESSVVKALPGYVEFDGVKRIESPTFAGMAIQSSRDLSELRLFDKDGRMWAWCNGAVYMPADLAKELSGGITTQVIGSAGDSEWLKTADDCVLSFEKPAKGRVIVNGPDGEALYDSAVDRGEVFAPEGSFVLFAGAAGDSFQVKARTITD